MSEIFVYRRNSFFSTNAYGNANAYPWVIEENGKPVAFLGSEEKARDWTIQLNEKGYVQAE